MENQIFEFFKRYRYLHMTDLAALYKCCKLTTYRAGDILASKGELYPYTIGIRKGIIRTYLLKPNGEEKTVRLAAEGAFTTCAESLINGLPYQTQHLCLVCESGSRARTVRDLLTAQGFTQVSVLSQHMAQLREPKTTKTAWTVDRQFRLVLALALGIFLVGVILEVTAFLALPILLFAGLSFSVITDNCYLKEGIARLPWNWAGTS